MNALPSSPGSIAATSRGAKASAGEPDPTNGFSDGSESLSGDEEEFSYNPRFLEYLRLFAEIDEIGDIAKVFPKTCRVCGRDFSRFAEFVCATLPKGHVFEDCTEVMDKPYTMVYRHCPCSNTLVMTLTVDIFPPLVPFWSMLRQEAERSGKTLRAVVSDFSAQCDRYILHRDDPCVGKAKP